MLALTNTILTLTGATGLPYNFNVYAVDKPFPAEGGIYIFNRFLVDEDVPKHVLIAMGRTVSFSELGSNSENEACIKEKGANCICLKEIVAPLEREQAEKDLLSVYDHLCMLN
jgi:hypothetical protein